MLLVCGFVAALGCGRVTLDDGGGKGGANGGANIGGVGGGATAGNGAGSTNGAAGKWGK